MTSIASRFKELYGGRDYEWYRDRIVYMQEFLTEERIDVLCRTVDQRTRYMTILTENTYHPQNASALIRHCEAFGVQDLHTVETVCKFNPNVDIVRGTDKWVDITRHASTTEAIASLKSEHAGVSDEIIESADEYLRIPMCGMVESLNVSASAAILIYMLSQRMRLCSAIDWQLDKRDRIDVLFRWIMSSARDAERVLERQFPL